MDILTGVDADVADANVGGGWLRPSFSSGVTPSELLAVSLKYRRT
jgi:hypothetical protein